MEIEANGNVQNQSYLNIPWILVVVCFLCVFFDGFDTGILSLVVPGLAHVWEVSASDFTLAFVLTNLGVALGYLSAGTCANYLGQRRALITGLLLYSILSLLTVLPIVWGSLGLLIVLRFITGLGLGLVLPLAVAIASDRTEGRNSEITAILVTLGLACGLTASGFAGKYLLSLFGPVSLFVIGGVLPIILAATVHMIVEKKATTDDGETERSSWKGVIHLLSGDNAAYTIWIWLFCIFVFVSAYILLSWMPTFLVKIGLTEAQASFGFAMFSFGGIVGGLVLGAITKALGIKKSLLLIVALAFASVFYLGYYANGMSATAIFLNIWLIGFAVVASQIGQLALCVALYPEDLRTDAVGWAAAMGRVGSVIGPGIAGLLMAVGYEVSTLVVLTSLPLLVGAVVLLFIKYEPVN